MNAPRLPSLHPTARTCYLRLFCTVFAASGTFASAQMDNGVPLKEINEWREVWSPNTGSHWRTKADTRTGELVHFDPFIAEIWRNPFSHKAEAVLREWNDDGLKDAKKEAADLLSSRVPKDDPAPKNLGNTDVVLDTPGDGASTDQRIAQVGGSVKSSRISSVVVNVNGRETILPVTDGRFTGTITLTVGDNQVFVNAGPLGKSNTINVICTDKPSRLWAELVWDGLGDVDLHVAQPNGVDVAYNLPNPDGGGHLDIDNTKGYGPEHYFISTAKGDTVYKGSYQIYIIHYRSDGPVRCRVTVFKNEQLYGTYNCNLNGTGQQARIIDVNF